MISELGPFGIVSCGHGSGEQLLLEAASFDPSLPPSLPSSLLSIPTTSGPLLRLVEDTKPKT